MSTLFFIGLWIVVSFGLMVVFGSLVPAPTKADDDEQWNCFNYDVQ